MEKLLGRTTPGSMVGGAVWIGGALVANEKLLARIFSTDGAVSTAHLWLIRLLQFALLVVGVAHLHPAGRKIVRTLYALGISLVLGAIPIEIYLRRVEYLEIDKIRDELVLRRVDALRHHRLEPGVKARVAWGARQSQYQTNSLGFRDMSYREVPKAAGEARILILGDSFAEGIGVDYQDTFIGRVGRMCRKQGRSVDILNGGVCSYCPLTELRTLSWLLEEGYEFDAVVLMLDISDVHDEAVRNRGWSQYSKEFVDSVETARLAELERLAAVRLERRKYYTFYPRIAGMIEQGWRRFLLRAAAKPSAAPEPEYLSDSRFVWTELDAADTSNAWIGKGIKACRTSIVAIDSLCSARGIHFMFVIYPHPLQLAHRTEPGGYEHEFTSFSQETGIECASLFPPFMALKDPRPYFIDGDVHWTEKGHEVVARHLFPHLCRMLEQPQ